MIIRSLLLFFIILNCKTLSSQEYIVHSIVGNVSMQQDKNWRPLKKNDRVHESTSIKINTASTIKLIDSKNRMIHTLSSPGTHKLQSLILQNKKDNSSISNKIYAEARQQSALEAQRTHKAIGAAKRASMDEETLETLYASLVESFTSRIAKGELSITKHLSADASFTLELNNNSNEELYVCILIKAEDKSWSSLLPASNESSTIFMRPWTSMRLDDFSFCLDEGDILVGIGVPEDYDIEEILYMLNENYEPGNTTMNNVNISFIQ